MGVRTRFWRWVEERARRINLGHPSQGQSSWFGGAETASGELVDEINALTYSAVFAAVRILAEGVAGLPAFAYKRRANGGKDQATNHIADWLVHEQPNPEMTPFAFIESRQGHVVTWGNAYAEVERDNADRPIAMWPLQPDLMTVARNSAGAIIYQYRQANGAVRTLPANYVLHVPGFGFDGMMGYSVISKAKESIGEAQGAQKAGASFWRHGMRIAGVLEKPGNLTPESLDRLRKQWNDLYAGAANTGKTAILEDGLTWKQIGIPPEDAQFLESRQFHINEIARWFHVPAHMLSELTRATFSNIEQQGIDFVTYSLRPWLIRWEQELSRKLFTEKERRAGFFIEFKMDALMRGETKSRFEAYKLGRDGGWMSVNEIRSLENRNPIEGGDVYLEPLNMQPAGNAGALEANRAHLKDAWARIETKEVKAMQRAAKKPGEFEAAIEAFYKGHAAHVREVIGPAVRACAETLGRGDVERYIETMADEYVRAALDEMRQLGPEHFEQSAAGGLALPGGMADVVILQLGGDHATATTEER